MRRFVLSVLLMSSLSLRPAVVDHDEAYVHCETVLLYSKLGTTAEQVIYHYLRKFEDHARALEIAVKLNEKGLLDVKYVDLLKGLV